ncbi:MAG TPA: flagellar biosynthetic protein FliR [Eubacteriaceae bacterium]|nr:flagellar biosynthetic protein FliR [Eubacteriaceae bacterium]
MFVFEIQKYLFILARITSFIVVAPGISHRSIPNTSKVAFSLLLSWFVYSSVPDIGVYEHTLLFVISMLREVIIGLAMGIVVRTAFAAVEMAGMVVDFQAGYAMGALFDPVSGTNASAYGRLFYWIALVVFFVGGFDHMLYTALVDSFGQIPPGEVLLENFRVDRFIYVFANSFKIAFSIGAPMILVLVTSDVTMGLISRTVPQINVFMLGMPLKSLIAMVMFLLILSTIMNMAAQNLALIPDYLQQVLGIFR